jgi:hypothetical protein
MNWALDAWALGALTAGLALLASLRLSAPAAFAGRWGGALDLATHPTWLMPLILAMGVALGLMIRGDLPPWPPEAAARFAALGGPWAAVTGFLIVLVVDLWMLWTPSMVAQRFAPPEGREAARLLPLLNLALGAVFLIVIHLLTH